MQTSPTPFNLLPADMIAGLPKSEQLSDDNPHAAQVARALFDSDVKLIAVARREGHRSRRFHPAPVHLLTLHLHGEMDVLLGSEQNRISLRPGDLVYCPPGNGFMRLGKKGATAVWLYIQIRDVPYWDPLKDQGPFVKPYESAPLMYLLTRRLLYSYTQDDEWLLAMARGDANMLLTVLRRLRHHGPKEVNPHAPALRKLVTRISETPGDTWTQKRMAEELHISSSTLLRACKEIYGFSAQELLIRTRMTRAGILLVNTDGPLSAIADKVGYRSAYSFSRLFSRIKGMPPIRYRHDKRRTQDARPE